MFVKKTLTVLTALLIIGSTHTFANFSLNKQYKIIQSPLEFNTKRKRLTLDYIREHYDPLANNIFIEPRMIVIHWTGANNINTVYHNFNRTELDSRSPSKTLNAGKLNLSSHFIVDRDGTIHQLVPETWMARHVIGLNRVAIGIENIGGPEQGLTEEQLEANHWLIDYLAKKHPRIDYLIGHYEYLNFWNSPLWEERYPDYISIKPDPGQLFMAKLNQRVRYLALTNRYYHQIFSTTGR